MSSEDREIQRDFWHRYVGKSRGRLGEAAGLILPIGVYDQDPTPFVEARIPVADLRQMFFELATDEPLNDRQRKGLRWLERFLSGEFKNGIGPGMLEGDQPPQIGDGASSGEYSEIDETEVIS